MTSPQLLDWLNTVGRIGFGEDNLTDTVDPAAVALSMPVR